MTGLGIFILVVCVIGAASVLSWVAKQVAGAYRYFFVKEAAPAVKRQKYLNVGHAGKLTNYEDLPHYKGRTGLFGLPIYEDIIVPDKHNYATVVYMDNPVKQWVYDWMASWKAAADDKDNPYFTFWLAVALAVPFLFGKMIGVSVLIGFVLLFLFGAPSGKRAVRRMAENAKDFTPDTWRKIYKEVAESREREDEIVRAIRRSGIH